jgi:hypothetical protein
MVSYRDIMCKYQRLMNSDRHAAPLYAVSLAAVVLLHAVIVQWRVTDCCNTAILTVLVRIYYTTAML